MVVERRSIWKSLSSAGEADLQSFEFALAFGLGDAGDQVVADFGNAVALSRIRPARAAP